MAGPTQLFTYSGNSSALTRQHWDTVAHVQTGEKLFFKKRGLIGEDKGGEMDLLNPFTNSPVVHKHDLERGAGDRIHMGQSRELTGDGVTGTTALEDSEEAMTFYNFSVPIEHQRHGTSWYTPMSQQRTVFDLKPLAIGKLSTWMAQKMDQAFFQALYWGYPTWLSTLLSVSQTIHPNVKYAGGAATWNDVGPAHVLVPNTMEALAVYGEENYIAPVMVDGSPHYIYLAHPRQLYTLRTSTMWQSAMADARERGKTNPLFTYADAVWANIIIMSHTYVQNPRTNEYTQGGERTNIRMGILLGANALYFATGNTAGIGKRTRVNAPAAVYLAERSSTDFETKPGYAMGAVYGARRADWTSDDGNSTVDNQSSALVVSYAPAVS